jgi:hypothetical protein
VFLATGWKVVVEEPDITSDLENELRFEAEEAERDAAKLAARARYLGAVAFDSMARGDLVTIATFGRSVSGTIHYAAGDLASIQVTDGFTDVNLGGPIAIQITQQARSLGHGRTRGASTFAARLTEYEMTGEQLEIVAPLLGLSVSGQITAVARDHVALMTLDEQSLYVPLEQIAFVIQRRSHKHS